MCNGSKSGRFFLFDGVGEHQVHTSQNNHEKNGPNPQGLFLLGLALDPGLELKPLFLLFSSLLLLDSLPLLLLSLSNLFFFLLATTDHSFLCFSFLELGLAYLRLFVAGPNGVDGLPLFVLQTDVPPEIPAKGFQFLRDGLVVPQNRLMHSSIPFVILGIEEELLLHGRQDRIVGHSFQNGDHAIPLIGLHCQDQTSILVVVLNAVFHALLHELMEIIAVGCTKGQIEVATVMGDSFIWINVLEKFFEDVAVCLIAERGT